MYDAGVAGQNASLARAAATAEGARTRVGEVLYAIDPEIAPAWPAKNSGIVEVWAGSGYGLRRSIPRMIDDIRAALERDSASAALRNYGPRAIQCAENALQGAERVRVLSEQVLATATDAALDPLLRQLDEAATALNNGVPSPDDQGCGLQQTFLYLAAGRHLLALRRRLGDALRRRRGRQGCLMTLWDALASVGAPVRARSSPGVPT